MNLSYVYLHYRNDTGAVFYIGIGSGRRAFDVHRRNKHWKNIYNRHGRTVDIISRNLHRSDACIIESRLIYTYKCFTKLANKTTGGDGGFNFSDDSRAKMSESHKNRLNSNPDILFALNVRLNIFRHKSIEKISHKVFCKTTGKTFNSICEAARSMNLNQSNISRHLNGGLTSCKGYVFERVNGETIKSQEHGNRKRVRCIETSQVWEYQGECAEFFNGSQSNLSAHLLGKRKTFRGHTFVFCD